MAATIEGVRCLVSSQLRELEGLKIIAELGATLQDRWAKARKSGRPVVGTWACSPYEIVHASGAFPVLHRRRDYIEKALVRGVSGARVFIDHYGIGEFACREIDGSAGAPFLGLSPGYDAIVTDFLGKTREFKEDWRRLQMELGEEAEYIDLEIPRGLTRSRAYREIYDRLSMARDALEKITGREITDDDIREACELTNEARRKYWELREILIEADSVPLRTIDIYIASIAYGEGFFGGEVERVIEAWDLLIQELDSRVAQGIGCYDPDAPRLLMAGMFHKRICNALERAGAVVMARWPCLDFNTSESLIKLTSDPLRGLAAWCLNTFGILDPETDARDILRLVRKFELDGVIYNKQSPFGYAAVYEIDGYLQRELEKHGYPVLKIEPSEISCGVAERKIEEFVEQLRSN